MVDIHVFFLYMFAHLVGFAVFFIVRITAKFLGK